MRTLNLYRNLIPRYVLMNPNPNTKLYIISIIVKMCAYGVNPAGT